MLICILCICISCSICFWFKVMFKYINNDQEQNSNDFYSCRFILILQNLMVQTVKSQLVVLSIRALILTQTAGLTSGGTGILQWPEEKGTNTADYFYLYIVYILDFSEHDCSMSQWFMFALFIIVNALHAAAIQWNSLHIYRLIMYENLLLTEHGIPKYMCHSCSWVNEVKWSENSLKIKDLFQILFFFYAVF